MEDSIIMNVVCEALALIALNYFGCLSLGAALSVIFFFALALIVHLRHQSIYR